MTNKFYGEVGFDDGPSEISPGVVEDVILERKYYGDIQRPGVNSRAPENIRPDLDITNQFSILADPYAYENFFAMRYIRWAGTCWEIKQIEVQRPRLIIRVGGVYNGPTFETPETPGGPDVGDESGDSSGLEGDE